MSFTYSLGALLLYFAAKDLIKSEQFREINVSICFMAPPGPGVGNPPIGPRAAGLNRSYRGWILEVGGVKPGLGEFPVKDGVRALADAGDFGDVDGVGDVRDV